MKKKNSLKKGFSLIEVMMATVIIGIVGAFLATSIPMSLATGARTQDVSRATDLAQRYMETIKYDLANQSTYDNVAAGTTPPVALTSDFTDSGYFTVHTNVTDIEAGLKEIDVEYIRTSDNLSIINLSTLAARPE